MKTSNQLVDDPIWQKKCLKNCLKRKKKEKIPSERLAFKIIIVVSVLLKTVPMAENIFLRGNRVLKQRDSGKQGPITPGKI